MLQTLRQQVTMAVMQFKNPFFIFNQFPLNARYLFIVRTNVSNLSQIAVRFVKDRWRALE